MSGDGVQARVDEAHGEAALDPIYGRRWSMHLVHSVDEAHGEAALDPYKDGSVGHLGGAWGDT
jgi:hypothetical protein